MAATRLLQAAAKEILSPRNWFLQSLSTFELQFKMAGAMKESLPAISRALAEYKIIQLRRCRLKSKHHIGARDWMCAEDLMRRQDWAELRQG